ncbi:MAG TPA: DUF255 domain-containing protein [Flavobacteriales bacterium]|nr:DUF255 domain-containing protein [Flavobacteriales bacterium]
MKNGMILFSLLFALVSNAQQKTTINWLKWEQASFDLAQKTNKPIFLDVGTEWCTACNWMEEDTYTDKTVIDILNKEFVCIKVDAEAQPDVGERYLDWGWPALIFMTSKGEQVQALQGNRPPKKFIPIIENIYKKHKSGKLKAEKQEEEVTENATGGINGVLTYATARLQRYYDTSFYGWTMGVKMPLYAPVELMFWRGKTDAKSKKMALQTLEKELLITDKVWGGIYFGSSSRDWTDGMPEKRSEQQAGALLNFAEAFLATGDQKWLNEANSIKKYLLEFLRSPSGLFYNSQEENISPAENPRGITSSTYFSLSDKERRAIGVPPIDKTLHTDINAKLMRAFLKLYEATGKQEDLQLAVEIMQRLNSNAKTANGLYSQVAGNENNPEARIRELHNENNETVYLHTQVYVGLALLNLFFATGDSTWKLEAKHLAQGMNNALWDEKYGAFASSNAAAVIVGGKSSRTYPFMDNAVAARFYSELSTATRDDHYREIAENCLLKTGTNKNIDAQDRLLGEYLIALEKVKTGNISFSVVDPKADPNSDLFNLVKNYYHPAKITKLELPGHYPDFGKPVLFVCSDNLCSQPIEFGENTRAEIDAFLKKIKR